MAQQTLIGEDYGLLSGPGDRAQLPGWWQNVTPRPNFYANLLYLKTVGDGVLAVSSVSRLPLLLFSN